MTVTTDCFFLPENLKFLCLNCNYNATAMLFEFAAVQCPNLRGLKFTCSLDFWTINAISRFKRFIAPLTIWIIFKIIICFSLKFLELSSHSDEEELEVMFRSGSLGQLQGLVIGGLGISNLKVLFIIISFSSKLKNFGSLEIGIGCWWYWFILSDY